jgi:F-type H+-transporting ATPase subunit b
MVIMKKIYLNPYLEAFQERKNTVKALIEEANKNNQQAQVILEEAEKLLNKAKEESEKILEQAHHETNQIVANILRKAQEEAEKEIQKAKKDIDSFVEAEMKVLDTTINKVAEKIANKILLKEKAA